MKMKYSVVLATLATTGGNVWEKPREVLEAIAGAGFDGVDLDAEPDRIPAKKFEEVRSLAASLGLKVPALVAAWGGWHAGEDRDLGSSDEAVRRHSVGYANKCIDLAAGMGGPVIEICCCPFRPEYPMSSAPLDAVRRNFVKSLREIGAHAAQRKVPVALEALNRFEGYAGFMNSVSDAVGVIAEAGNGSVGVLADLFHINIEDTSPSDALRTAGPRLMHVHMADSNRAAPGTGHIDFLQLLRTLRSMGYTGYLSLDCVPAKPDWKTLLQRSITYMKQLEQILDLQ
ncbi:MAG: sugar phosphate isomerase/epimerase [Acidobacteria bacterium]|nr:sugar phosphate isomerase/epimerase [Acidobacteriota bacterium]